MADVLIFDDDPSLGDLMGEILRDKGLTVSHFLTGAGAGQLVQENRPRLVVLDIMMPGMDGLTACRALKSNPTTRGVKVAVLTAKDFLEDRDTALRNGADLFFNKPFDPGAFERAVSGILGFPQAPAPHLLPPAPPLVATILPGAAVLETAAFCLIFDAGRGLSAWVERQRSFHPLTWLLLSRYQPRAVAELRAAARVVAAGGRLNAAGPDDAEGTLQRVAPYLCANKPDGSRGSPLLYPQREGEFSPAPGARVAARLTQHPGACLAYRLDAQGKSFVYCPAHEIAPDQASWNKHEHEKFRDLFEDADLLVHGYRRSLTQDAPKDALGRGAWEPIVDLAAESGVKRLLLLPLAEDAPVDGVQLRAEERLAAKGSALRCEVSRLDERLIL